MRGGRQQLRVRSAPHLHVPLWLHEAPHAAKRRHQVVGGGVSQHAWDDGVVWARARRQAVWMPRLQHKVVASVLQREAAALHGDATAGAYVLAERRRNTTHKHAPHTRAVCYLAHCPTSGVMPVPNAM